MARLSPDRPRIAVLIATYNRASLLDECLRHLAAQPFESGDQVIVVDNGSTDDTSAVIDRHAGSFPARVVHLVEPQPGKSHALARGIAAAVCDVLALTDDDVNVADGWLSAVRNVMADPEIALMGGPVMPRWERTPPRWLRESAASYGRLTAPLALLNYGSETVPVGERSVIGANMAVRYDVLIALGGFAVHLGKLRGTLLSGEDHDLCRRVAQAGLQAVYSPAPVVTHWVPARRMRVGYFLSWFFWSGITNAALDGEPRGRTLFNVPLWVLRRFAAGGLSAAAAALTVRRRAAVEHAIDAAYAAGYAARRWRLVGAAAAPDVPGAGEFA